MGNYMQIFFELRTVCQDVKTKQKSCKSVCHSSILTTTVNHFDLVFVNLDM